MRRASHRVSSFVSLALALAALLPAGPATAQTAVPYVNTMRLVAATTAVPAPALCQVADGWLYTIDNGSFRVVDLADPVAPVIHGQLDGLGTVSDFVVAGQHAYLGRGDAGLIVLDLADRAHPQVAGTLALTTPVAAVALYGPLVALAGGSTFTLVDAAAAQTPTVVGSAATIDVADLAIVGDYALVTGAAGIASIDLADPALPVQVALFQESYPVQVWADPEFSTIVAEGERLAVRSRQWVLETTGMGQAPVLRPYVVVLDASHPEAPVYLAGAALDPYVGHVTQLFRGDRVILNADGDLQAFDTATMQSRGLVPGTPMLGAAAWAERFLYAARGNSLAVYDLAYPETVLPFATWGADLNHSGGSARYDLATRMTWSGMLSSFEYRLYDVADPLAARVRISGGFSGDAESGSPAAGIASIQGDHVLLGTYDGFSWGVLTICDLSSEPVVSAGLPFMNASGTISGHIVWVRTDDNRLVAVDFSALPTLRTRGEIPLPGANLVVQDEGACLLGFPPYMTLLDLADPDAPQVKGTVALPGQPLGALFRGGLAYVLCDGAGLQVIDLTDPQAPVISGMLSTGLEGTAISAMGDRAVIANASGFQMLSLADAAHPQILSPVVGVPGLAGSPVFKDNRAYAGHAQGMDVFDVADPAVPVYLGSATGLKGRACDGGGWIVLPGGACPLDDVTPLLVDDDPVTVPTAMAPFRVAPNPFNPRTTVNFSLDRPHEVDIAVYDVRGAKLRTLVTGHWAAGEHAVTWDGCRDDGRPLSSGPYIIRLRGAGGALVGTAKVTLVR